MQERIILAPGAKSNELVKSLAAAGKNCFNVRILSGAELARLALMRSGITIPEEFLSSREECTIIANCVKGETYFGRTTYSDIQEIAAAIRRMRSLVVEDEDASIRDILAGGIFTEKNQALYSVYKKYMSAIKRENMVDSVSIMKLAIEKSKPIDACFMALEEYPLSPLDAALLRRVSGESENKTISIRDLFELEEKPVHIEEIKNCYGAPNEVETIINNIYADKKLDQCTVALTDAATYSQLFFDYALLYDIPITFGCGLPIINTNPARLLVQYYKWITSGFFGKDSFIDMVSSKAFNKTAWSELFTDLPEGLRLSRINDIIGGLRLTNDEKINSVRLAGYKKAIEAEGQIVSKDDAKSYKDYLQRKLCIPFLEIASRELTLPAEEFVAKYSYVRRGSTTNADKLLMKMDMAAVAAIYDELGIIRRSGIEQSTDDLIMNVLRINVCSERSEPGKLHITNIAGAISTMRQNLYVAGLSASKFPGSPAENYLLLDDDLKLFGEGAEYMTSEGKIRKKQEQLVGLVELASAMATKIYISYSGLNVSELKKDNASSMLYELYKKEKGTSVSSKELEANIKKVEYFEPAISVTREIGKAYNQGKKICDGVIHEPQSVPVSAEAMLDKEWSPSAINLYFEDPRKFMFAYMLDIPVPEEDIPYDVISAVEAGNLAHLLMEQLANTDISRDNFLHMSEEYFDIFVAQNPPLIMENIPAAKVDFLEMMEIAYDNDPGREVALKEEDIHYTHSAGVKLRGFPDRVEKLDDGSYIVVDFKSGRTVRHIEDDITSCIQVVIYAYMLEQQGYHISRGEFRYLRSGEVITCKYDDEMKQNLEEKLTRFRYSIENFDFTIQSDAQDDEEE